MHVRMREGTKGETAMARPATVLVVDDEPGIVELMRDFLEVDGFRVRTASTGDEALATLANELVDCVMLDILLPGASGFEVLRRVREISTGPVSLVLTRSRAVALGLSGALSISVSSQLPAAVIRNLADPAASLGTEPVVAEGGVLAAAEETSSGLATAGVRSCKEPRS